MAVAIIEVAVIVLALVAIGTLGLGGSRLRTLSGRVGSFVCGARLVQPPGGAAVQGIAQYGAGRLDWWRSWSLDPRPAHSWQRTKLVVTGHERLAVPGRPDLFLVRCQHLGVDFELTMSPEAFAGLTSWLESAPPRNISSSA